MDYKAIGSAVSAVAPLLGKVISAANPIAGIIVTLIGKLFGINMEQPNSAQVLSTTIQNDPDAGVKLKQLELEHQDNLLKTTVDDRENARAREIAVITKTGKTDSLLNFIALVVIVGYFIMSILVCFTKLDRANNDVLYLMVGQLTGGFIMVLSYYFGSSNQ